MSFKLVQSQILTAVIVYISGHQMIIQPKMFALNHTIDGEIILLFTMKKDFTQIFFRFS